MKHPLLSSASTCKQSKTPVMETVVFPIHFPEHLGLWFQKIKPQTRLCRFTLVHLAHCIHQDKLAINESVVFLSMNFSIIFRRIIISWYHLNRVFTHFCRSAASSFLHKQSKFEPVTRAHPAILHSTFDYMVKSTTSSTEALYFIPLTLTMSKNDGVVKPQET